MTLRAAFLAVLTFVAVAGLSGCAQTGPEICNPAACVANPNYTPPGPVNPPPSSTGPDYWWLPVNPCKLLTAREVSSLGVAEPAGYNPASGTFPENACDWNTGQVVMSISLSASPYTSSGGKPFRASDGRPGEQIANFHGYNACQLSLQAADGSSATIFVAAGKRTPACPVAVKVADIISPELPQ